ncbi:MAG: hypothetical protein ABR574_10675 [Cryomorphaceae bacterium]|nr:hypothetical protein [Flavobacteriales bacterium]
MGLFDKLFGNSENGSIKQDAEQAVIVRFLYGIDELEPLYQLENELKRKIDREGVGEFDWHEIAIDNSDGFLYMYGPNAEILFKTVKPILEKTDFMRGAIANLRFGPPEDGVSEIEVEIKNSSEHP